MNPRIPRPSRRRLAIVLAAALTAGACGIDVDPSALPTTTSTTAAEQPSTTDEPTTTAPAPRNIAWSPCPPEPEVEEGAECGTLEVPIDWEQPDGPSIGVALARRRATGDPAARIGSIVVHPGGPGGSGVDIVTGQWGGVPEALRARFDVVGFDSRGTAHSAPVDCVDDATYHRFIALDPTPDDAGEQAELEELTAALGQGCGQAGDLLARMGTRDVARDLDAIRTALGDEALTFVGYSYGTRVGTVYADLFPGRVRAMVLDGPYPTSLDDFEGAIGQVRGFTRAFGSFLADCEARPDCPLNAAGPPAETVEQLIARVEAGPIRADYSHTPPGGGEPAGRAGEVGPGELVYGIVAALYDREAWDLLAEALASAAFDDWAGQLLFLSDFYNNFDPATGTFDNQQEQFLAVSCADEEHEDLYDDWAEVAADYDQYLRPLEAEVDAVGRLLLRQPTGVCLQWPAPSADPVQPVALSSEEAPPAMVISVTGDPATPREWAGRLADEVGGAPVLSVTGEGHVVTPDHNPCVDGHVTALLTDLTPLPDGATC